MALTRTQKSLFLLVLSALLTPWFHHQIKPYRVRVEIPYFHDVPTPIYLYFSNKPRQPTAFAHQQTEQMQIVHFKEMPPPMSLTRAMLRSTRPITGLRLDPAVNANLIRMGPVSLSTYTATHVITVDQLEPFVRQGAQIVDVHREGEYLSFRTTGNDPNFILPLPPEMLSTSRWQEATLYLLSFSVSAGAVLFVSVLAGRHRLSLSGSWRRPVSVQGPVLGAWTGWIVDLGATVLLAVVAIQFVALYTRFDFSPLVRALDKDGVGETVPREVRNMKALVQRNGPGPYVLDSDMGLKDDESEIFQRATEYLYPARIVHRSRWVFAREGWPTSPQFGHCKPIDRENLIVLHACQP